ncbi:MAG: aminoglycoside phosphotransferase family protein [Christensenellaceae bacterium]|nr:aminoglycoside phosphotransferase family protein [Christensenellaceae bacterium]
MLYCWTTSDNFETIIRGQFPNSNITAIKNGWTNFVFLAEAEDGKFVFRFPRTKFFEAAMLKEFTATKFIADRIATPTAIQELRFCGQKPYTVHKYIDGEMLSVVELNQNIAEQIADYLLSLKKIKYYPQQFARLSSFLIHLARATKNKDYDYETFVELVKLENTNELVLCHGDFNAGNVLIYGGKISAVLDYAFATISTPMADLARMCNRLPPIADMLIDAYQTKSGQVVDKKSLNKLIAMWNYIDSNYINYMRRYHPEVDV